jgi:hypothetical protein
MEKERTNGIPGFGTRQGAQALIERNELLHWAEVARSHSTQHGFRVDQPSHFVCHLPCNIQWKNRFGRAEAIKAHTQTIGMNGSVLTCRRALPLFGVVQLQLDDGTPRPWIHAKVIENKQTVSGYLISVEYVADEPRSAVSADDERSRSAMARSPLLRKRTSFR